MLAVGWALCGHGSPLSSSDLGDSEDGEEAWRSAGDACHGSTSQVQLFRTLPGFAIVCMLGSPG